MASIASGDLTELRSQLLRAVHRAVDDDEEPVAEAEAPKTAGQQTLMGYGSDA